MLTVELLLAYRCFRCSDAGSRCKQQVPTVSKRAPTLGLRKKSSIADCEDEKPKSNCKQARLDIRVGFWQNGFSRIFIFGPPDFFADFLAGFFLLIFVGEKVPRKILQENPRENPPIFIQQKSSDTLLQNGRAIDTQL